QTRSRAPQADRNHGSRLGSRPGAAARHPVAAENRPAARERQAPPRPGQLRAARAAVGQQLNRGRAAVASAIPSLEESIRSLGFASLSTRPVSNYAEPGDALETALAGAEHWLPGVSKTLSRQLPVPKTVAPFVARPFFRPPGSYRSFYYGPSTLAGVGSGAGS